MSEIMQIKKRNPIYDCAKGLGILFVVMGHCAAFGYQFYTKFHVLFFFIFAGLMLKTNSIIDIKSLWSNIVKFWRRYALPYIICNSLFLIFYNFFVKYHLITHDSRFTENVSYIGFNVFITKLVKIVLLIASSEQLCGATWFLRSLFFGLVTIAIILYITRYINKKIVYSIVGLGLFALTSFIDNMFLFLYAQSVICIMLGDYFKTHINKIASNIYINAFLGAAAMILLCIYFINIKPLSMLIYAVCGFVFILQFTLIIKKYVNKVFEILSYIGQKTLPILCLHLLCFKIVTYLYIILTKSDISLLGAFPALNNTNHSFILSILYVFIGTLFPLLGYQIYIKIKSITNFINYKGVS